MKTSDVVVLGVAGIAVYVLYRLVSEFKEKVDKGTDAVAGFIATPLIKFLLPEPVGVNGSAILPNGKAVSMNAIYVQKMPNQEVFYFDYGGQRFQLGTRSTSGNYPTKLISA
jgi:hypothetical protein